LTLLRSGDHRSQIFLSPWKAATLWTARVNDGSIAREEQTIAFDAGAGSAFTAVQEHQTVWVGTAAGLHDVGKVRIKSISSGDAGVTGTLVVGANGLDWSNNDYLTFIHDYELWSCLNRVDGNDVFYKDWDADGGITYTDENNDIPPVPIAGPNQVGFLSGGTISFDLPVGSSYAMASAATISTKVVTVYPSAGVTVNAEAAGIITIDITAAGYYVAKITVTDSRSTQQVSFRKYIVHVDDPSDADYPFTDMSSVTLTGDWKRGGWRGTVRLNRDADITNVPEGNYAILWRRTWYGSTQKDISLFSQGTNILLGGYLRKASVSKEEAGATLSKGTVSFEISSVENLLTARFLFSVPLEINASPTTWWQYTNNLMTAGHIIHYLYRWHSTMFHTHDFVGLDNDGGIDRKAIDFDKGTLYHMGNEFVEKRGIQGRLVGDKSGRIHLVRNLAARNDTDRAAATTIATLTEPDTDGTVTFVNAFERRVAFLFFSGVTWDGSTANPVGSTSPATIPDPRGGGRAMQVEHQMISDQTYSNQITGQLYGIENNEWPEVRADITGDYVGVLEPAVMEWWEMDVASGDTPKGFIWTDQKLLIRRVNTKISLPGGVIKSGLIFETEVDGTDGVPYLWPGGLPDPGGGPPSPGAAGFALLTGSSIYYLPGGSSTWALRTASDINDVIQDPYWRTAAKQNSSDPADAIILTAEDGQIRRSINSGQSFSTLSPGNPPNDAGDSPAPVLANLTFTEVEANKIVDGTFVWTARWLSGGGNWRSWLLSTDDNGATFTWASIGSNSAGSVDVESTSSSFTTFVDEMASCKMTDTKFLSVFTDDGGDHAILTEVDGGVITELDEANLSGTYGDHQIIRLTDEKALYIGLSGGVSLRARVLTITSDTIVQGSELTVETAFSAGLCRGGTSTSAFVVYWSNVGGNGTYFQKLSISGTTVSKDGSRETVHANRGANIALRALNPDAGAAINLLVCYRDFDNSNYPTAQRMAVSPFVAGSQLVLESTAMETATGGVQEGFERLAPIAPDSTTFVFTWISATSQSIRLVAIDASSATLSAGTVLNKANNAWTPSLDTHGTDALLVSYFENTASDELRGFTISVSGTTITDEGDQFAIDTLPGLNTNNITVMSTGVPNAVLIVTYGSTIYIYAISLFSAGPGVSYVLGMSVGKGSGLLAYVTEWTSDNEIVLRKYGVPDLVLLNSHVLGDATLTQVVNRTWWAHPFAVIGDDNEVILYGRMNNPGGLGTVHMLWSNDAGATVIIMELGFGEDHVGAMAMDEYSNVYAIRNIEAASPKLYAGVAGGFIFLLSTIPITGGVNPKAISADWAGNVIVGMDVGQAIMVLYSPSPYIRWFDITGNHGTARGINSIEVL
jgi:hypothetical protein